MRIYIEFARFNKAETKSNFAPYSLSAATTKRASDGTTIESNLPLQLDTTYKAAGHYYIYINESNYVSNVIYYVEFTVTYQNGNTSKTIKRYFSEAVTTTLIKTIPLTITVDAPNIDVRVEELSEIRIETTTGA